MKKLSFPDQERLVAEIREELIQTVTKNGGHLASNLGVVELTVALHSVLDSPRDKIIWDVGHQSYVHKLLTGRRDRFNTLRQPNGLSGFTDPEESEHDAFLAGHASTSVSAAFGMAVARDLHHEDFHVVAVIGDGAMSGGIAFEALNNAGHHHNPFIVVLNDNQMSIAPSVGAIGHVLDKLRSDPRYFRAKVDVEHWLSNIPGGGLVLAGLKRVKRSIKGLVIPTLFWEEMGFTYLGPVDGHDLRALQEILGQAKLAKRPVLVHVNTVKGKGYVPAEQDAVSFHGLPPNGQRKKGIISYTEAFSDALLKLARQRPEIVAITAAMPDGTGLVPFAREFPERFFDVGIAEQHAITFAAGMARQGFRPVVAIYSTFLQRGYDQVIHDVCLQKLPVVFAIDRAGIVGEDGRTHQGLLDIAYLRCIPDLTIMAPKDENELQRMLCTALQLDGPCALRYPRGEGLGVKLDHELSPLPIGKGEVVLNGDDLIIFAVGTMVASAVAAAMEMRSLGVSVGVVNVRFIKPLDEHLIVSCAQRCHRFITLEEGALAGGFGSAVLEVLHSYRVTNITLHRMGIPDEPVDQGPQSLSRERYGLSAAGIAREIAAQFPELVTIAK